MRIIIVLVTVASMYLLTACNSNSGTAIDTDSSSVQMDSAAVKEPSMNDSAMMENSLSKSMDPMMQRMHSMIYSGDFDIDFANMMIAHHQGAIDMARAEVANSKDEKLKEMASEIITKEEEDQQELTDFVKKYKPSGIKHGQGELEKLMMGMMDKSKQVTMSGNTDKDFANMMIMHNRNGIAMAKLQVKNGMDSSMKKMAQNIMGDQQKEISEFEKWIAANK